MNNGGGFNVKGLADHYLETCHYHMIHILAWISGVFRSVDAEIVDIASHKAHWRRERLATRDLDEESAFDESPPLEDHWSDTQNDVGVSPTVRFPRTPPYSTDGT